MPPEEPLDRHGARGLAHGVVARITSLIVGGQFRPGDKLPAESALMERYGVSRTVIREALLRLQASGLVETHRGRGSFVLTMPAQATFSTDPAALRTTADLIELLDFRLGCEVEAAALAASRRSPAQLQRLRDALARFDQAESSPAQSVEADFRFHLCVAEAAGNRYYVDLLASLGPTMIAMPRTRLATTDAAGRSEHFLRVSAEHANMLAAIERGDAQGAAAATRIHLANSRARLLP